MGRNTPSLTAIGFWNAAPRFGSSTSWANAVQGSEMPPMAQLVPDPQAWTLDSKCQPDAEGRYPALLELLAHCTEAAFLLSDDLTSRYFAHSGDVRHSVGA